MKKLSSNPIWIAHNKQTNGNDVIYVSNMEDRHLIHAYHWACKRYTKYHNEVVHEKYDNLNGYQKLYYKLRELELEACKRNCELVTPQIQLIHRDRKFYWKDTLAFPQEYLENTTLSVNTIERIKNIAQLG